jgi:hypothetical protein
MGSLGCGSAWLPITWGVSERWYQGTGGPPLGDPELCLYNVIPGCSTSCGSASYLSGQVNGKCPTDFYLVYFWWFTFSDDASGTRYCLANLPQRHQSSPGICYDTW